jgi:hypothetical protein
MIVAATLAVSIRPHPQGMNNLTLPITVSLTNRRTKTQISNSHSRPQSNSTLPEDPTHVIGPRPVHQFKPPSGFEPSTINGSSRTSDPFLPSNTQGKQIWYITAPASVPITTLKEVALEKVVKGQSVFSHESKVYGFVGENGLKSTTSVLLQKKDDFQFGTKHHSVPRII